MTQKLANSAAALLTGAITNSATSITIESAYADLFPVANTGTSAVNTTGLDWFKATLEDTSGNREIVYVRTRASGIAILSNVIRGQEGTTALAFASGSVCELRVTKTDIENAIAGTPATPIGIAYGGTGQTTAPAALAALGGFAIAPGLLFDYAGTSAPTGFLACDGAAVSRTTYAALFSAIGTTWGVGDGATTFNVPDLRRKATIGSGGTAVAGPANTVGATGGSETYALSAANHAAHTHGITDPGHNHGVNDPGHAHSINLQWATYPGTNHDMGIHGGTTELTASTNGSGTGISLNAATTGISGTQSQGSATAFGIMQPSAVVTKIIKT